ncbi:T9SS type A sorting domain-containing protein [Hymenobacter psoromatis]|uniref:T9SS type A sorting domain-containing protein n=1 Tax=Hymenobacter psoromatis TaxID=1484116 RepID=UPI001CBCC435|nr:T9SS type A sorting domain-containing protein [Hymenobacter psoromatis]
MRVTTLALSVFLAALAVLPGSTRALGLTPHVGVVNNGGQGLAIAPWQTGLPFQTAPALTLFPNPARGLLTVQLSAQHGPDYKLRLSNVLGREVRLLPLPLALATNGLPLDVTGLPAGLYFCSLLVNDKAVSTNRLTLL